MIDFLGVTLGVAVGGGVGLPVGLWLMRRKHRRRVAAGPAAGIPCMTRTPAGRGRWRVGRVYADQGAPRWQPRRGEPVLLTGARATGVRAPSIREGISINPSSRIVTWAWEGGAAEGGAADIEIAVMPLDLRELLGAVPQAAPEATP
ncbi:hypothetical protein [Streptomyces sp. NBC_00503]|uniref:hypothetical protein n=1 Tax=Streptomyces sp. NBC_00503 TaxID=2903659 RepID=UPI002E8192DC|nr:hypothetical protein [Streptomyces sp. NBC_00503]WUD81126.1 hypothetical protein OG490_11550 [Streptomyces sp. NBC_00503]